MGLLDNIFKNTKNEDRLDENGAVKPIDMGNGVLYFDTTGSGFSKALSAYLGKHPNHHISAIAPNIEGLGTAIKSFGFFVVVEKK